MVVLLHYYGHGSPGGKQFVGWFAALKKAGYRCLAPSFPGHGGTPGPAPSSKPDPGNKTRCLCEILERAGGVGEGGRRQREGGRVREKGGCMEVVREGGSCVSARMRGSWCKDQEFGLT